MNPTTEIRLHCGCGRFKTGNHVNAPSLPAEASTCPFHVPPSNGEVPKRGAFSQLGTELLETEIETKRGEESKGDSTCTHRAKERESCGKLIHVGFNCSKGSPSSVGHLHAVQGCTNSLVLRLGKRAYIVLYYAREGCQFLAVTERNQGPILGTWDKLFCASLYIRNEPHE